ncbi:MAG: hypothetical protein LBT22_02290 [Peptococcaceae bacterium]|nr:hypothetical protein [Peptococcaceae bacterium]
MENRGKITTVEEVVKKIPNGAHIGLPGFAVARNAVAFAHEIIRQGKKDLTVSQCVGGMDTELLVSAGAVKKLIYSTGSLDRYGPLAATNRAIGEASLEIEEHSGLSITLRYLAGSLGISHIPCNTLLGSDILTHLIAKYPDQAKEATCPFTGEKQVLLRSLEPEFGVVVANYADEDGNAVLTGPLWDLREMANASKHVIVFAEKIVTSETIRNNPEKTVIPGAIVDSLIELPYNAYPTVIHQCYDFDGGHLKKFGAAMKDPEAAQAYLKEYVLGTANHEEYLNKAAGIMKLLNLAADPYKGY